MLHLPILAQVAQLAVSYFQKAGTQINIGSMSQVTNRRLQDMFRRMSDTGINPRGQVSAPSFEPFTGASYRLPGTQSSKTKWRNLKAETAETLESSQDSDWLDRPPAEAHELPDEPLPVVGRQPLEIRQGDPIYFDTLIPSNVQPTEAVPFDITQENPDEYDKLTAACVANLLRVENSAKEAKCFIDELEVHEYCKDIASDIDDFQVGTLFCHR